jgi:type II secretory pathway pseudopilin PulG
MRIAMATTRASSSQSGFAIIEVVVSAAVLAIVALAVLSGIDGATGSSGREKARAIASSLAEKDQERLRAMSVDSLKALAVATPYSYPVDGVTYTVKSDAQWVTDDTGGTPSCGNSSNNAEYFHITSTVTSSTVGSKIAPVKIDSLVSPSVAYSQGHGTLGAKIVDRAGKGLANIDVSGTGLTTQKTDQNGCVMWRSVPVGNYTVSVNVSGYCDETGATIVNRQQSVSPNTVAFVNFSYDKCAQANITVKTHVPGQTFSTASTNLSKALEVTDVSSNGTLKTWAATPASGASSFTPKNLFPYPATSYGFFTGQCAYQSPEKLGLTNYFTNTNPGASLLADPTTASNVSVFQPPVRIKVSKSSTGSQPAAGSVQIYFTPVKPSNFSTDTCTDDPFLMTIMTWPSNWTPLPTSWTPTPYNTSGWATQISTPTQTFDPGLPFGDYSLCFVDTANGNRVYKPSATYNNKAVDGGPLLDVTAPTSSWVTGSC